MNSFWLYFRFCKEHDDEELWDMLVDYAVHKPTLIYQLLTSIGTHVHPKILIEKIELGLEIPHLKKALAIIMQDYRLQVTLQVHTVHFLPAAKRLGLRILWVQGAETFCFFDHV